MITLLHIDGSSGGRRWLRSACKPPIARPTSEAHSARRAIAQHPKQRATYVRMHRTSSSPPLKDTRLINTKQKEANTPPYNAALLAVCASVAQSANQPKTPSAVTGRTRYPVVRHAAARTSFIC
jgi:hypothetical protein